MLQAEGCDVTLSAVICCAATSNSPGADSCSGAATVAAADKAIVWRFDLTLWR